MVKRTFDLEERLIDFVLKIDQIVELLPNIRLANHLAGQLIRNCDFCKKQSNSKIQTPKMRIEY